MVVSSPQNLSGLNNFPDEVHKLLWLCFFFRFAQGALALVTSNSPWPYFFFPFFHQKNFSPNLPAPLLLVSFPSKEKHFLFCPNFFLSFIGCLFFFFFSLGAQGLCFALNFPPASPANKKALPLSLSACSPDFGKPEFSLGCLFHQKNGLKKKTFFFFFFWLGFVFGTSDKSPFPSTGFLFFLVWVYNPAF